MHARAAGRILRYAIHVRPAAHDLDDLALRVRGRRDLRHDDHGVVRLQQKRQVLLQRGLGHAP